MRHDCEESALQCWIDHNHGCYLKYGRALTTYAVTKKLTERETCKIYMWD